MIPTLSSPIAKEDEGKGEVASDAALLSSFFSAVFAPVPRTWSDVHVTLSFAEGPADTVKTSEGGAGFEVVVHAYLL